MRPLSLPSLALLVLTVSANAQTPRPATALSGGPASGFGGFAAEGSQVVTFFTHFHQAYASFSADCGVTWGPLVRLDTDAQGDKQANSPDDPQTVHLHDQHVYATWSDDRSDREDPWFARSTDGGTTFTELRLDDGGVFPGDDMSTWVMEVAEVDRDPTADRIYVLFTREMSFLDRDLYLVVSEDGGASFGSAISVSLLNGTVPSVDIRSIAMAAREDELAIAWTDDRTGDFQVYFTTSLDRGATFAPVTTLSAPARRAHGPVRIAVENDTVVVAWQARFPTAELELHMRRSTDFGTSFGADKRVGNYNPSVDALLTLFLHLFEDKITCAWMDQRTGFFEAYTATSCDGGQSFVETRLSEAYSNRLAFFADGERFAAAWWNRGGSQPAVIEPLHIRTSDDAGATWAPAIGIPLFDPPPGSIKPFRGVGDGALVAWVGYDPGPFGSSPDPRVTGFNTTQASIADRSPAPNPASYVASSVLLGGTWSASVDLTTTGHTTAQILVFATPIATVLPQGDFLLVGGRRLLQTPLLPGPLASFSAPIPNDVCLSGITAYSQAVHLGGFPFRLTNAQDLTVGSF